MKAGAALLAAPRARIVAGAVIGYVAWQLWLALAAPAKIVGVPETAARANVVVTLPFPPERFHLLYFQRYGRVSGTQDNSVELRGVRGADLTAVARPYWVRRVEPLPTGG